MSLLEQWIKANEQANIFQRWINIGKTSQKLIEIISDRIKTESSLANHFDEETQTLIHEIADFHRNHNISIE